MTDRVVAEERRQKIIGLLSHQGIASYLEIMEATNASEATARRDLVLLEREGYLERTRGGAKAIPRLTTLDEEFEIRRGRERREKRLAGRLAAGRLTEGMTLFLNDGSSTYALAHWLLGRHFTVVTTGTNIAEFLAASSSIEVIVIGGRLRATSFGTEGPLTVDAISVLHADVAIIGCDGISLSGGVRSNHVEDAGVARAMGAHSSRTMVLASPAKVGREAWVQVFDWPQVDELVATSLPPEFREGLSQYGTRVTVSA